MIPSKSLSIILLVFLVIFQVSSLTLPHHHYKKTHIQNPENSTNTSCTQKFCEETYGLEEPFDPFNPKCDDNVSCWKEWYGFPDCEEDDLKCWKQAVGYPKDCKQDDYDCWLKTFGYAHCEDVKCIKDYLNYTCAADDLQCWRDKVWISPCKWNQWDCWIKNNMLGWYCHHKKGFQCISSFYNDACKQDDQKCWRQQFYMPDPECQKDVECFKKFYYLPTCKDDDFQCWNKLMYGPNCEKGDMKCLKQFLWIPTCENQTDQLKCYKDWLQYPECGDDDVECWKNYEGRMISWFILYHHDRSVQKNHHRAPKVQHTKNFGRLMEHKRKNRYLSHKLKKCSHNCYNCKGCQQTRP